MFRKYLFLLIHRIYDNNFMDLYHKYIENQWKSLDEHKYNQEQLLNKLLNYSYSIVPFYQKLFDKLRIHPNDINKLEDLSYLPILTKEIINSNWNDFIPKNLNKIVFVQNATGGTTGTPLRYRVSKEQRTRTIISQYRGWNYAGYQLGDKLLYFGGTSIGVGKKFNLKKYFQNYTRNIVGLSAYDLDNDILTSYVSKINYEKPEFIRSFPSAIYFLSKWIIKNNFKIHSPKAIFTTSEKLYPDIREFVENVFETKLFDNYGLADGGLSAYECNMHNGMHIDYENSIFEVLKDGKRITSGEGKAIATSLYNYAFPFIRYETGDLVRISDEECECGRKSPLIKEIISRSVDFFITPNQRYIHGWFFYIIMETHSEGVEKYQIVQKDYDKIEIKLIINEQYKSETGKDIIKLIKEKETQWNIDLIYVDKIETTKGGKYKFIVNEILLND